MLLLPEPFTLLTYSFFFLPPLIGAILLWAIARTSGRSEALRAGAVLIAWMAFTVTLAASGWNSSSIAQ